MKNIHLMIRTSLFVMGMASLISCNNEEDAIIRDEGNLLKINTCIADTRDVVTGTTFRYGDQIGVYVRTSDGKEEYTAKSSNIKATFSDSGYSWNLESDVTLRNDAATVYAYYPYNANVTSTGDSIDINITQNLTTGQPDYMYGSCSDVNQANTTANIKFYHALARITLAVTKGTTDVGDGKITGISLDRGQQLQAGSPSTGWIPVKNPINAVQGRMDLKTGGIKATQQKEAQVLSTNYIINEKEATNIEILVIPINILFTSYAEVTLTIDGCPYSINLGSPNWEAGKQYTYPITINRSTLITPTVTPGEKIYLGFNGDNGKPLYWSSYNLGATAPEDYGGLYGWGDATGEKTSTDLSDYPSATPPTDINNTDYNLAKVMWGSGWRIPSNGEMWRMLSNCTEEWTSLNGIQGVKYTSNKNGNSIFFPIAPQRQGENIIEGTSTYYWLNKINEEDNTMAGTFYIRWNNGSLLDYPTAGQKRYIGLPIRPVTEEE